MAFKGNSKDSTAQKVIADRPSSLPLSEYAKGLDSEVHKRYLDKVQCIGIDPFLLKCKASEPDCLPPVESTDILCYLVLETSFYTKEQFKNFRSLAAYNQLVSGFITSVQGHKICYKFVVLAEVRHSQRMNDVLIPVWIITEETGVIVGAHCRNCKAGLGESCSHVACLLYYLESWTKVNGKLSCTQMKCQWILPHFVKEVEYARVRDIDFKSAQKLKSELDDKIENLSSYSTENDDLKCKANQSKDKVSPPNELEMKTFYEELSKCKSKPVVLSVVPHFSESYVLASRKISTVPDLFDSKYLSMSYPELIDACMNIKLMVSKEDILQIEKDTIKQAKGINFFKHRAGRIGASQSKAASHTDPALPAKTLLQSICYPELCRFKTKATEHGCKHESLAIRTYEQLMQSTHKNFKVKQCGLIINEEMPWLHATPDFLCECDCCGEGCGEVKCPLCLDNCDFENYVHKKNSCLQKSNQGHYYLPTDHQYYYQVQQQLFTTRRPYCDFVVCAVSPDQVMLVRQRILPDKQHWTTVVPKLERFWRVCVLPEVLGRWSTRRCVATPSADKQEINMCYCRSITDEDSVKCCNPQCPIGEFHLSCLGVDSTPKKWYCPNCRALPDFKPAQRKKDMLKKAMEMTSICVCNSKAKPSDKILECTSGLCSNGTFFHLSCLNYKRMPNNSSSWLCSVCALSKVKSQKVQKAPDQPAEAHSTSTSNQQSVVPNPNTPTCSTSSQPVTVNQPESSKPNNSNLNQDNGDVMFVKSVTNVSRSPPSKYSIQGTMGPYEYGLIRNPSAWLDCVCIQSAQVLLKQVNKAVQGFQSPTLGPIKQFDIMTGDFIQILHVNGNHWVCMTSLDCPSGYVIVLDSLHSPVSRELQELAKDIVGPNFKGVRKVKVQQQLNGSDCGVFAIAFATCLVYGQNPVSIKFDIPRMRPHLENCLKSGSMTLFPTT